MGRELLAPGVWPDVRPDVRGMSRPRTFSLGLGSRRGDWSALPSKSRTVASVKLQVVPQQTSYIFKSRALSTTLAFVRYKSGWGGSMIPSAHTRGTQKHKLRMSPVKVGRLERAPPPRQSSAKRRSSELPAASLQEPSLCIYPPTRNYYEKNSLRIIFRNF